MFKIEIRKKCKICNKPLIKRQRTYCSKSCRYKVYNKKYAKARNEWTRNKRGKYADNKIECLVCGKYYRQVGTHIVQMHDMTAREYREYFELEVKKGILPDDLRKLYGEQALENGTYKNLKIGKKFWFKKGQKGVGIYQRSPITIERLKKLHKLTKVNKKHDNRISNKIQRNSISW